MVVTIHIKLCLKPFLENKDNVAGILNIDCWEYNVKLTRK